MIPKSSATVADVLRYYGYSTAAFGKDHNTPISPPHVDNYENYHLTEAMADKAITWMRRHLALQPDKLS